MQTFASVTEALDFAIAREQEAHDFYVELSGKAGNPAMATSLLEFAQEELGHKAKLLAVKQGDVLLSSQAKVMDLKIGDYLVEVSADEVHTYQQALVVAMKQEKAAYKLYMDIAASAAGTPLQDTFIALANEEAKHKLRFELEYDEYVLREN
jgi:rubrerythrin